MQQGSSTGEIEAILGVRWPLAWRLVDLPDLARQIRVLSRQEDEEDRSWVMQHATVAVGPGGFELVTREIEQLAEADVTEFLMGLDVDVEDRSRLLWAGVAPGIEIPTGLAFRHFCDLWYPGSDDLWLFDRARSWVLACDHEGLVRFARIR